MDEGADWPVKGLPLAEWLAALRAIELTLGKIDNRLPIEATLKKNGTLEVITTEARGILGSSGHRVRLRKVKGGWKVSEAFEWASCSARPMFGKSWPWGGS